MVIWLRTTDILRVETRCRLNGYHFCKRLVGLHETVPFTRVNVTALLVCTAAVYVNNLQVGILFEQLAL